MRKKNEYDFALIFELLENENAEDCLDALYEAGCDDATIGMGKIGFISVDFIREAESCYDAIESAIANVKTAIPHAKLIHVSPDLIGVKELSLIFDCTRQNIQKYVSKPSFPTSIYKGNQALWHLESVLDWFMANNIDVSQELIDVAHLSRHINLNLELENANTKTDQQAKTLIKI